MEFIPTSDDLIILGAVQRNKLKVLNVLPTWTDEDVEDVLLSYHEWLEDDQEWAVSVSNLTGIAFDARTPDGFARILQKMVNWATTHNLTHIHPHAKPDWI